MNMDGAVKIFPDCLLDSTEKVTAAGKVTSRTNGPKALIFQVVKLRWERRQWLSSRLRVVSLPHIQVSS
jgi:hypothetical protein